VVKIGEVLKKVFLFDLFKGLAVTFRHQNPEHLVTEQYPLERPQIAQRYRGMPRLLKNEDGSDLCTACGACALACPEKLIKVGSVRDPETKKKILTGFDFDIGRCMFCGLCEEACPPECLELTTEFEVGLYTREGTVLNRSELEQGVPRKVFKK
jgi:NADH-quinone oxidoreductase subunit I